MYKYKDITKYIGKTYGNLTIIGPAMKKIDKQGKRRTIVRCECSCENHTIVWVTMYELIYGHVRSCGCLRKNVSVTHNLSKTKVYKIYHNMITRCYNPNATGYERYGGRGICICDDWHTPADNNYTGFLNFYNWMYSHGYHDQPKDTPRNDQLSIDRIDTNGNYSPQNCRIITMREQAKNKHNNRYINDGTNVYTYFEFARVYNLRGSYVIGKIKKGWNLDAIVYAAKHPELGIHRPYRVQQHLYDDNTYFDKDGFMVLIPKIENQFKDFRERT